MGAGYWLALGLMGFSAAVSAASVQMEKTISGFSSPESVVVSGKDVFVSNLGVKLEPTAKDGDGFISRLDRQGNLKSLKWAENLHGPKGMIALEGVLYVADIDRVVGFRMADGKQVLDLDMAATGAQFLNGFARIDNRRVLLSATDIGKVFVIDLKAKKYEELAFDIPPKGPNGMKVKGGQLIVVEWGIALLKKADVRFARLHLQGPGTAGSQCTGGKDSDPWHHNIWGEGSPWRPNFNIAWVILAQRSIWR